MIISACISVPCIAQSADVSPPIGPYRSIDNNADIKRYQTAPDWLVKRQTEMNQLFEARNQQAMQNSDRRNLVDDVSKYRSHNAQPVTQHNQQQMNRSPSGFSDHPQSSAYWNKSPHPGSQPIYQQHVDPYTEPQMNSARNYFPMARGPVYGPAIPPSARYNYPNQQLQPGYQTQRPVNPYPPMWQ